VCIYIIYFPQLFWEVLYYPVLKHSIARVVMIHV
jgi:Na+-transporting NADH:ubiquinone oxidoreductase subunit NqrB